MKTKKLKLEVAFIGGQDALSPEEEKALSEFFTKQKSISKYENLILRQRMLDEKKQIYK